ncbi:hypothetical protein GW17_00058993 [Ensete ventricosum]|nr:hypothetical protein GW17_00058993 [Ensete ventricosum]
MAGCSQGPLQRGDRLRLGPLQGAATRRHDRLGQPAARPPASSPQGPTARNQVTRGGCPRRACKWSATSGPPAASPAACAGATTTTAQRGAKRGLRHPFEKRMILAL